MMCRSGRNDGLGQLHRVVREAVEFNDADCGRRAEIADGKERQEGRRQAGRRAPAPHRERFADSRSESSCRCFRTQCESPRTSKPDRRDQSSTRWKSGWRKASSFRRWSNRLADVAGSRRLGMNGAGIEIRRRTRRTAQRGRRSAADYPPSCRRAAPECPYPPYRSPASRRRGAIAGEVIDADRPIFDGLPGRVPRCPRRRIPAARTAPSIAGAPNRCWWRSRSHLWS